MPKTNSLSPTYLQGRRDALAREHAPCLAATNGWARVDRNQVDDEIVEFLVSAVTTFAQHQTR